MITEIKKSHDFDKSMSRLKDQNTKASIENRLDKILASGEIIGKIKGIKHCTSNVLEMIFANNKGTRVYFSVEKKSCMLLLLVGNKNTQIRDIEKLQSIHNKCIRYLF